MTLKKIGYSKQEIKEIKRKGAHNMTVQDIITLGNMGYTKDEIESIRADEKISSDTADISQDMASLKKSVAELKSTLQASNVRAEAVKGETDAETSVDTVLQKLAGVHDGYKS